ncbi:MAG TPA: chromate transporter [Geobacterales bacterium]|nr:chromate transporter [Geobacterales bacterium]
MALTKLALLFLRLGIVFFGGGYVLIPLLHRVMVEDQHWLSQAEFLDGVALSQLTPGPLAMLATFSGFRAGSFAGALVATVAIFLPCTLLMLFLSRHYRRLREIELIRSFLDGLLPAVLGLVAAAAYTLGSESLATLRDFSLLAIAFLLLTMTRLTPMVLILGAGLVGYLLQF